MKKLVKIINVAEEIRRAKITESPMVLGEGAVRPLGIIIGEALGEEEVKQGRPFIGRSGQLLRSHIEDLIDLVFITNSVLYRPENNRTPTEKEVDNFAPYIKMIVEGLAPKAIMLMGKIPELLAKKHLSELGIEMVFNYHPAFILRRRSFEEVFANNISKFKLLLLRE